ncbi:MAG: OmpA family protein [Betaproteobacteria bacterium]
MNKNSKITTMTVQNLQSTTALPRGSVFKPVLSLLAIALVAAGCATTPNAPPALLEARSTVSAAASNPAVLANAPLELQKANEALSRAEQALTKHEDIDVNHNSYIATQRARTAIAAGTAKASEDMIKSAEAERERARADAKSREAARAQASASAARADARDARADANVQRAQADISAQQALTAQQQADLARAQAAAASGQAANAQAQVVVAQNQAAVSEAYAASLAQRLATLEALKTERGMVITLGDVLFEFGRAEVRPSAQARMAQLADFLKQYPDRRISIEGHTDSVGSVAANNELSQRRADAVKAQLMGLGVSGDRISTVGYGKDFPVAANDTDTNRAINRRVEVVISEAGQRVRARR